MFQKYTNKLLTCTIHILFQNCTPQPGYRVQNILQILRLLSRLTPNLLMEQLMRLLPGSILGKKAKS
jgi:hypothetical protein